jgi:hypothetical protein
LAWYSRAMTATAADATRVIFRTEALMVSMPFVDGAPVENRNLAYHTSLQGALDWIGGEDFWQAVDMDEATQRLLFIRVTERALDVGPSDYRGHVTLSATGDILARSREGGVLAFGNDDFAHTHPTEAEMLEMLAEVPEELLLRLKERLRRYPGSKDVALLPQSSRSYAGDVLGPVAPAGTGDERSERTRPFPACCLQSDAGFLFTSIDRDASGVDGFILFSAGEFARHPCAHGPRLLIVPGDKHRREGLERAVEVRLTSPPEVLGTLPRGLAEQVVLFVEKNRDVLLRHWKLENDSLEALELLERV